MKLTRKNIRYLIHESLLDLLNEQEGTEMPTAKHIIHTGPPVEMIPGLQNWWSASASVTDMAGKELDHETFQRMVSADAVTKKIEKYVEDMKKKYESSIVKGGEGE